MMLKAIKRKGTGGNNQPEWFRHIKVGDVLRSPGGKFRVVRNVTRYPNGNLSGVWFTITQCSWTKRCYTIRNYVDLRCQGWEPTGIKVRLGSEFDWKVYADFHDNVRRVDCCDVKGIA